MAVGDGLPEAFHETGDHLGVGVPDVVGFADVLADVVELAFGCCFGLRGLGCAAVAEATAVNRSSMGQDVDNNRPTEIAAINGFIVDEAKKLGIETPVNFALTALVQTLENHYK